MTKSAATSHAPLDPRCGEWMLRAQAGDREAYRQLLSDIGRFIERNHGAALHGTQSVEALLMRVHRSRHTYRAHLDFERWLASLIRRPAAAGRIRKAPLGAA